MRKLSIVMVSLGFSLIGNLCYAMGGIVHDPWNTAQNAATTADTYKVYLNSMEQIANQVEELNNERIMLESSKFHHFSDAGDAISHVRDIANTGSAMTYSTKNLNTAFDKTFGSKTPEKKNWADKENAMMQTVLDTSKGTLTSANKQMGYTEDESNGLNQIVTHSDGAEGTKAVLQGTNRLLEASVAQQQTIQQSLLQQQSQEATKNAAEAAREKAATEADKKAFGYNIDYTGYKVDDDLKEIPDFNG